MKQKNKGITLIALVITIIVLLILAGVSIATLTGENGILGKARETKEKTEQAESNEKLKIEELEEFIDEQTSKQSHSWEKQGDILICRCKSCLKQDVNGFILTVGQEVNYQDRGTGKSTISGEISGTSKGIEDGVLVASDYGENGEQTVTRDVDTKWIVLGIEDSDGNETNETLLLTTANPTTDKITLYGGNPYYYNADNQLNIMCNEIYGNNARNINENDVNNVLDYTPTGGMYYPETVGAYLQIGNFETRVSDLTDDYYNLWNSTERSSILYNSSGEKRTTFYTPKYQEGIANENELGDYIVNGYWYLTSSEVDNPHSLPFLPDTTSTTAKKVIFGDTTIFKYYLSCKGVGVWKYECCFGLRLCKYQ